MKLTFTFESMDEVRAFAADLLGTSQAPKAVKAPQAPQAVKAPQAPQAVKAPQAPQAVKAPQAPTTAPQAAEQTPPWQSAPADIQTTAPSVDQAALMRAMRQFSENGKTQELFTIFNELGAAAFPQVREDQYPELAEKLRAHGATL